MKAREQQLKRDEEAEEEERIERERKELNEQHRYVHRASYGVHGYHEIVLLCFYAWKSRKEVGLENNALGPDSEFRDEGNNDADAAYKA